MALNVFQKRVCGLVLNTLAEQNANEFDERAYSKALYAIFNREDVMRESWSYHWRTIKPSVERNFGEKVHKIRGEELQAFLEEIRTDSLKQDAKAFADALWKDVPEDDR